MDDPVFRLANPADYVYIYQTLWIINCESQQEVFDAAAGTSRAQSRPAGAAFQRRERMSENQKKTFKQVCKCENCGNEAEMVVTCELQEVTSGEADPPAPDATEAAEGHKVRGTGTCAHCGNESEIWVDI